MYYIDYFGQPKIQILDKKSDIDDIWADLYIVQSKMPQQNIVCDVLYYGEILEYEPEDI